MHKFTKNSVIDFDKYEKHLRYLSHIYLDKQVLLSAYFEIEALRDVYYAMTVRYMNAMSGTKYNDLSTNSIIGYMVEFEKCGSWRFESRKNKSGLSINRKDVLEPILNSGQATEFLTLYLTYSTYKKLESSIRLLITNHSKPVEIPGNADQLLHQCNFNVNQQQNFRYNYSKHDIITIPKQYSTSVTVPKGKVLAWGDFSQADLRAAYNIFLRADENIKIVRQYDDMYEAIARIVADANGEDFNADEFKAKRDIMKAVILSCVYGKRTDIEKPKADFLKEFGAYLDNKCPKYMEYKKRVDDHDKFMQVIVLDTYFGQPVVIDRGWESYGDNSSVANKCLNYPVQSCTSLIVLLTVNAILDDFYALGYTEDQIGLYYTRHDEPIFIMDEEVLKDSWVFEDYKKIFIDDWYPMNLAFEFGYNYKRVEETLMDKYKESVQLNQDKLHYEEMDPPSGEDFYPLGPIYHIAVSSCKAFDGSTIYALYDLEHKECAYIKQEDSEDFSFVEAYLCSREDRITKAGYCGVKIFNDFLDKEAYYKSLLFKYIKGSITYVGMAETLAEQMAVKYANKYGGTFTPSQRYYNSVDTVKGVRLVETLIPEFS